MINIDLRDWEEMLKSFKENPDKFNRTFANMLNRMAFGTRKEAIEHAIPNEMIVRNKGLLRSSIRYQKANPAVSVDAQYSQVETVPKERFSAWYEQQVGGQKDTREHVGTLYSRSKSKSRQIKGSYRLKPDKIFVGPNQYKGMRKTGGRGYVNRSENLKNIVMMQMLSRISYKRPFIISGHNKLRPGLYKFLGQRGSDRWRGKQHLKLIQSFDRKPVTIKKHPWMSVSMRDYFKRDDWYKPFEQYLINSGYKRGF